MAIADPQGISQQLLESVVISQYIQASAPVFLRLGGNHSYFRQVRGAQTRGAFDGDRFGKGLQLARLNRCIFISYSSRDAEVAEELESMLRAENFDVWRDRRNVETDWSAEIARALTDRADVLCLLWSEAASESEWVRNEWLTARAIEKLIVTCLLPGAPSLPPPLVNLQWAPRTIAMACSHVPGAAAAL